MKYLYYSKSNKLFDIRSNNDLDILDYIEISDEQATEIKSTINADTICKVNTDDDTYYFEINVVTKRAKIITERDSLFTTLDKYRDNTFFYNRHELTEADIESLESYYNDIADLDDAYDLCLDKQNFYYTFVTEKSYETFTEDMTVYELVKPDYVI